MHVVILHSDLGPCPTKDELDTLEQAIHVEQALTELGLKTSRVAFSSAEQVCSRLNIQKPDVVFNLVESPEGSDRNQHIAPVLLDALSIPYTGSNGVAMRESNNKIGAKIRMCQHSLPTPHWYNREDISNLSTSSYPLILKSIWEHASTGIGDETVVRSLAEYRKHGNDFEKGFRGDFFAERFIEGREFNVSVLELLGKPYVLPAAEMLFRDFPPEKPRIVNYAAKWDTDSFEYHHTQRTFDFAEDDMPLISELQELAKRAWYAFDLNGYARVDFRVDHNNQPWILELNANPCITPDAGFSAAASRAGISFNDLVAAIVHSAISRHRKKEEGLFPSTLERDFQAVGGGFSSAGGIKSGQAKSRKARMQRQESTQNRGQTVGTFSGSPTAKTEKRRVPPEANESSTAS